ncbi:MAG: circularly permuted type 2 ATP-grasp protein, partial [Acetobacteraceae bacterium]|nr:circularly permuted type 2 ATP-grasp protein [Acetobacteraceae bacterium]
MVLDEYHPREFYCELVRCEAAWPVRKRLSEMSIFDLKRRAENAETELYNLGITFTVYSEKDAIDRTLPFDVIPRVISADEWQ